jgi:solute carrier family 25 phosphate transporter 3
MATAKVQTPTQTPNFAPRDYVKFFGAGALAATLTHGVRPSNPSHWLRYEMDHEEMKGTEERKD